jgi:hypothetical protein
MFMTTIDNQCRLGVVGNVDYDECRRNRIWKRVTYFLFFRQEETQVEDQTNYLVVNTQRESTLSNFFHYTSQCNAKDRWVKQVAPMIH